jgi:hypothetical protein
MWKVRSILSDMESSQSGHDAAAQLAEAEGLRSRLATGLRLPAGFHVVLGVTTAAQMAASALGIGAQTGAGLALVAFGCVLFLVVAAVLGWRFRAINGVWVGGLLARSVLGMTTAASWAYGLPFAGAVWAALAGRGWLAVLISVAGGAAYAVTARRWWATYQQDPAAHARGETAIVIGTVLVGMAAGVIVLVGLAR